MFSERDQMIAALKALVIPNLKERGFTGSFPHFRRLGPKVIDLVTFQFDRHGGGFVIEISQCDAWGHKDAFGKLISPKKVTAWDLHPSQRFRIKPGSDGSVDSWFRYDQSESPQVYTETSMAVMPYIIKAEEIWIQMLETTCSAPFSKN